MMKRALALLVLAFAAALPAAEWTLAGFPTHWDQSGTYNAYTPGKRKCGCIAVAGAAVLQFYNATKDPGTQTVECSIDSEPIWLTTRPGAYDWDNADDALYGRVAYNLGVQVGMNYGGQESSAATERLAGVLESYGLTCTYARRMATGGFTQAELEAHLYVPLRLGWPVILGIRGGGASHAVVATGVRPAAGSEAVETRLFAGFGGKGDGWYALPEAIINDIPFDTVTDILIVRTQAEGDRCWQAVYGAVSAPDGTPVTLTCGGETHTATTAGGAYALAFQAPINTPVQVSCGGRSVVIAISAADELPRAVDFDLGAPLPAEGTLSIGPGLASVDLERDATFPFRCYRADGKGGSEEVPATWAATLSNGVGVAIREGRLVCDKNTFVSATLTVTATYDGKTAATTATLYPRMWFKAKSWTAQPSQCVTLLSGERLVWPGVTLTATGITLTATTGGRTMDWTDLSEAEFAIGTRLSAIPSEGRALTIPYTREDQAPTPLNERLYAWRVGDGLDEEAGVVGNSPLGPQSAFSTLGAEYGYVPDSWLAAAFQDIPTPKDAAEADSDGDGYANWEEWVAGTNPKDAGSALRVTGLEVGADGAARVEWAPRAPGRKAVVVGAEALGGPWREDPGAGARFFRVRVSLE